MENVRRIGIMQPYIFPYIGYFHLINAVDKFVFYDDVSYIKQGWINRNNFLLNNEKHLFTVPLDDSSSFRAIKDIMLNPRLYPHWKKKWSKSIEQAYRKTPYYEKISDLINNTLDGVDTISELTKKSILNVATYLDLSVEFVHSSTIYNNNTLTGQDRILSICAIEKATTYVNPIGGQTLYNKELFKKNGIDLFFVQSEFTEYKQFENAFIPGLSIIDVMMFNSPAEIKQMLGNYKLI